MGSDKGLSYLSLEFLQRVVDRRAGEVRVRLVQSTPGHANVYQAMLAYPDGSDGVPSVFVKSIEPDWPLDEGGEDREAYCYQRLLPCLDLPHAQVYYAGVEPPSNRRVLILADQSPRFDFHPPQHVWSEAEAKCVLRTYARLHALGVRCLPPRDQRSGLMPRHETRWTPQVVLKDLEALASSGTWGEIPGIGRLVESVWAQRRVYLEESATLLHSDVYPPNIGVPKTLEGEAVLIDWGMASWGLGELDLAYMFMQPFRSERGLDRGRLLQHYWGQRERLGGIDGDPESRSARQRYADSLLAISLIPVARRVAGSPFPQGSGGARYWEAMFPVLHARLIELAAAL